MAHGVAQESEAGAKGTLMNLTRRENITIEGNAYVKAYGQGNASGIGGGYNGNAQNIIIKDNAYVVAKGGGAGIGSGVGGGSSNVNIQDGTVVAEGSYTGIGGHYGDSDTSGKPKQAPLRSAAAQCMQMETNMEMACPSVPQEETPRSR